MALIIKRKFRRTVGQTIGGWSNKDVHVCGKPLAALFNIPRSVKIIWISLHTVAAEHREPMKVRRQNQSYSLVSVSDPTVEHFSWLYARLSPFLDVVYVEVEYE